MPPGEVGQALAKARDRGTLFAAVQMTGIADAALILRGDDLARALSPTPGRAADAVQLAPERAVQVHGAMGYSWETDVHLFLKRGLVLAQSRGSRDRHLDRIATRTPRDDALQSECLFDAPA